LEEKRKEVVVPPAPPVKERPAPAVTPMQNYAEYQEKQILDIVVDAPSLVKREAWVRIAERVIGLYQTSSEAALKFLEQLLKDPKPVVRMSIVEALVRIATPETLDIMLKMLKDPDFNVQREVIKGLKTILAEKIEQVPDAYRKKIQASLEQEVEQGGWVV
jgi:HEAT repeat protein